MDQDSNTTPDAPESPKQPSSNKKTLYGVLAGVAVLLVVLIALVVALLMKNGDDNNTDSNNSNNTSQNENGGSSGETDKQIVKTIPTNDDKFEVYIYKPKQTGSGTNIEFGLHNKCDGCQDGAYGSLRSFYQYYPKTTYLLDEDAGKKYDPITDADGNPIATPSCGDTIDPGKTLDCFQAFTKVPSGTTVSLVFEKKKIDGIAIP